MTSHRFYRNGMGRLGRVQTRGEKIAMRGALRVSSYQLSARIRSRTATLAAAVTFLTLVAALGAGLADAFNPAQDRSEPMCSNGIVVMDPEEDKVLVTACRALLEAKDMIAGGSELNWSVDISFSEWDGDISVSPELVKLANGDTIITGVTIEFEGSELAGCIPTASGEAIGPEIRIESDEMEICGWEGRSEETTSKPYTDGECFNGQVVRHPTARPHLVMACEALLRARDIIAGDAKLQWSADLPIREWRRDLRFVTVEVEDDGGDVYRTFLIVKFDGRGLGGCIPEQPPSDSRLTILIQSDQIDKCVQ